MALQKDVVGKSSEKDAKDQYGLLTSYQVPKLFGHSGLYWNVLGLVVPKSRPLFPDVTTVLTRYCVTPEQWEVEMSFQVNPGPDTTVTAGRGSVLNITPTPHANPVSAAGGRYRHS